MSSDQPIKKTENQGADWPSVNIGNTSNPSPNDNKEASATGDQLLGEQAEKYLREVANIEDLPDAQDEEEMDKDRSRSHQP